MTDHEELKLSTHITIKLFETLSDSNKKVQEQLEKQTEALDGLVRQLREGVQLSEIKNLIQSGEEQIDEIDSCTEAVSDRSDEIVKILRDEVLKVLIDLRDKLVKVITVIVVAFSLTTMGYFIVKAYIDYTAPAKSEFSIIEKDIEGLKKELSSHIEKTEKRHSNDNDNGNGNSNNNGNGNNKK